MTFNEADVNRKEDGKFGEKTGAEPETGLPGTVTVQVVGGSATLTPGVLDGEAEEAFASGQCVAFATAVAEKLEGGEVWLAVHKDEKRILHAWAANSSSGINDVVYDVYGDSDFNDAYGAFANEDYNEDDDDGYPEDDVDLLCFPPSEVREGIAAYSEGLPPQEYEIAATFTAPYLEHTSISTSPYAPKQ